MAVAGVQGAGLERPAMIVVSAQGAALGFVAVAQ